MLISINFQGSVCYLCTQQVPNDIHRYAFLGISRVMSLQDLLSSNIVAASPGLHVVGDSLLYKLEGSVVFNIVVRKGGGLTQESNGEQGTVNSVKIKSTMVLLRYRMLHVVA